MTRPVRVTLLAGYGLATFLAFPHPLGDRVLDLGWLVAWCVPGCLALGLRGLGPGRAAAGAFIAGWLAHGALFHWIYVVTVHYGHAPVWAGVMAPLALALYPALALAAFGALLRAFEARGRGGPWVLALLWTLQEHVRGFALSGFPWGTLGYAQHENPALLGLAPFTAVYGLSFVTALGSGAALGALDAWRRGARLPLGAGTALAGVALAHALGAASQLAAGDDAGLSRLRVAVVQGNIDQGVKWSPAWAERTLEIYEELSREAARQGAEAILWPETAVPGSLTTDPGLRSRVSALARELDALLVVGGVGIERTPAGPAFFDSAFVFDAEGSLHARYDKAHLVPFGEYLPLRAWLGRFLTTVASGMAPSDVTPGPGPEAIVVPRARAPGHVTVGVPICYELLFPDLVRRFVRDGASVLFALTNDAWYGRTGAPHQFLAMTAVRSAENRVWTARAANTGVSAFIDHRGRVRERTRIFQRDVRVADVPLRPPPKGGSPYTRAGDVFALTCWVALALRARPGRRPRRGGGR